MEQTTIFNGLDKNYSMSNSEILNKLKQAAAAGDELGLLAWHRFRTLLAQPGARVVSNYRTDPAGVKGTILEVMPKVISTSGRFNGFRYRIEWDNGDININDDGWFYLEGEIDDNI